MADTICRALLLSANFMKKDHYCYSQWEGRQKLNNLAKTTLVHTEIRTQNTWLQTAQRSRVGVLRFRHLLNLCDLG